MVLNVTSLIQMASEPQVFVDALHMCPSLVLAPKSSESACLCWDFLLKGSIKVCMLMCWMRTAAHQTTKSQVHWECSTEDVRLTPSKVLPLLPSRPAKLSHPCQTSQHPTRVI